MTTEIRQTLITPHESIEQVFFPESGFASVTTAGTGKIEIGMIGCEGLVGASPVLLGSTQSPYEHFIQARGEALSVSTEALKAACSQSPSLHGLLLRYIQTLVVQMAQTAFVNASFDVESRLARWLLMCQDRIGGHELVLTHEFVSMMLGVQRTSVTLAIQTLEGAGPIRARRGRIEVRDRSRLIAAAGAGYGVAEAEYDRLIGSRG